MRTLNDQQRKAVDDVCDTIFYHNSDATHRERLKGVLTLFAELLVQDIPEFYPCENGDED